MKLLLVFFAMIGCLKSTAQVVFDNALIKTSIETHTEANGNVSPSTIIPLEFYIKGHLSRVSQQTGAVKTIRFLDNRTALSTILIDKGAGNQTGFTITAADKAREKRIRDSIDNLRQETTGNGRPDTLSFTTGAAMLNNITYLEDEKEFNGIQCRKAMIRTADNVGIETVFTVWYTNAYAFAEPFLTANRSVGFFGLKGIPLYYESRKTMSYSGSEVSFITVYQVSELKTLIKIEDGLFDIPKEYVMKSYQEWLKENPSGVIR